MLGILALIAIDRSCRHCRQASAAGDPRCRPGRRSGLPFLDHAPTTQRDVAASGRSRRRARSAGTVTRRLRGLSGSLTASWASVDSQQLPHVVARRAGATVVNSQGQDGGDRVGGPLDAGARRRRRSPGTISTASTARAASRSTAPPRPPSASAATGRTTRRPSPAMSRSRSRPTASRSTARPSPPGRTRSRRSSATLAGSGTTSSPNFAGSVSDHRHERHDRPRAGDRQSLRRRQAARSRRRDHPGRLQRHDLRLGQRRRHRLGHAQRQRGQRAPGLGHPSNLHDRPEHAHHLPAGRPDEPRRHLHPHGQRPAGLDGHDRRQRQRHRDAGAGAPERHVPDPDHRAVADRPQPRSADHRRSDDHAHAAGDQLHRRARPAVHRPLQRRAAPHGLPRHDPEPRPGRRHLQPHLLERPQRLHAPRQRHQRHGPGRVRRGSSASTCSRTPASRSRRRGPSSRSPSRRPARPTRRSPQTQTVTFTVPVVDAVTLVSDSPDVRTSSPAPDGASVSICKTSAT